MMGSMPVPDPLNEEPLSGKIRIVDYDSNWPEDFRIQEQRIRGVLGSRAITIEHTGSTSVPGLCAKPIIDIILVVRNSAEEDAYVPALERIGYSLHIREPGWHEHRMLNGPDSGVNLHVFSE